MKNNKINYEELSRADLEQADDQSYAQNFRHGLDEKLIREISTDKNEPEWLLNIRLEAFAKFQELPMPKFGPHLDHLNLDKIRYFSRATDKKNNTKWEDVDPKIKRTFEKLRIPESEQKFLAGAGAQFESESVYHNLKEEWSSIGVLFCDLDEAVKKYPEIVKKYFGKCVAITDHKFSALHYAVFSGGTFLYIPENVEVTMPLQSYFRMNSQNQGQFEHTLIIADKGSKCHYIEGCSAPKFGSESLHAGCVEIFVQDSAKFRYSSVENWSQDVYNLNTKRAIVSDNGTMEWVGGNLGSGVTMLYPMTILSGKNGKSNHLGIAVAGENQNQDVGSKVLIAGDNCRANIVSKSISKDGGISTYRGLVKVTPQAKDSVITVNCDALMMDQISVSDTIPTIDIQNNSTQIAHEASAGKISDEVLLFFQRCGIDEEKAQAMIVNGFLDEVVKTLPLEFASELNRLIELEMEGSIG